jgi:hypothetical protein
MENLTPNRNTSAFMLATKKCPLTALTGILSTASH